MKFVICPYCNLKLYLEEEEIKFEKYIFCWLDSIIFKNPNYIKNEH